MKKSIFKNLTLPGSAFIMVFVLTSLLALVGLIFLLTARVDKLSTSAIEENKQLDAAVDTVIAQISQQLVMDTPGIDPNGEYYDYPDYLNPWLASLEPYKNPIDGKYCWRQISDVTGFLKVMEPVWQPYADWSVNENATQNVSVDKVGQGIYVDDYPDIEFDIDGNLEENSADADGDGIADSKWIELLDMTTNKGEPVYAAIRIIDNSAMLNVNTAYKFDLTDPALEEDNIDGSSQLHVNLSELSQRGVSNGALAKAAGNLHLWRSNYNDNTTLSAYESNVIWKYNNPSSKYTPFDISDELELRNRYLINRVDIDARIEEVWDKSFQRPNLQVPATDIQDWFYRAQYIIPSPDGNDIYSYRHLATTNSLDRIIDPNGNRMVNVNRLDNINPDVLYPSVYSGLSDAGFADTALAGQITANMKDFSDDDSDMTVYGSYYGFEQPCIFISELAHTFWIDPNESNEPNEPKPVYHSYSIEVSKHFPKSGNMDDRFELVLQKPSWTAGELRISEPNFVKFYTDRSKYYVIVFEDPNVPLLADVVDFNDSPDNGEENVDPDVVLWWDDSWDPCAIDYDFYFGVVEDDVRDSEVRDVDIGLYQDVYCNKGQTQLGYPLSGDDWTTATGNPSLIPDVTYYWRVDDVNSGGKVIFHGPVWSFTVGDPRPDLWNIDVNETAFDVNDYIRIERILTDGTHITVDEVIVDSNLVALGDSNVITSYQREMSNGKFIKRLWAGPVGQTLGHYNVPTGAVFKDVEPIQIFFGGLNNIGEIGKVLRVNVYDPSLWDVNTIEPMVRIDVNIPVYQKLFNYLTVFDPNNYGHNFAQTRIKGRININTAPWYVISQLPWISKRADWLSSTFYDFNDLAKAITNYRDNTLIGYQSIGQLNNVPGMHYYLDEQDQFWYPDLSTGVRTRKDGVTDDFEERDLIFARISDLVTVRSDVFTAYILVRLGRDGPQKRVIAILDRSEVLPTGGKVKVRALYEVPDAR